MLARTFDFRERGRDRQSRSLCVRPTGWGVCAVLVFVSGCYSGEGGNNERFPGEHTNHPPVVKSLTILPTPVVLSDRLTVRVEAQDPDLNPIRFRYRWLVNGKVIAGQTGETLLPDPLKRGDQVLVEVTPFDGMTEGAPYRSVPVTVANTPPIISGVTIEFDHESQGRRLLAKVDVVDPDKDPILIGYRWRKNDTVVKEGEENTLELAGLTAKDSIQVEVTASDGLPAGVTRITERMALSNSAPKIVSSPSLSITDNQYDYLVRAMDADEDPIAYELETSPPGMTIDANTGRIQWRITPEQKGSHRVKIVVKDPQGGFATQEFELSIAAPPKT